MRRVLLCHQPTDGGVGRHIRDLSNGLASHGWEVVLCSPAVPAGAEPAAHIELRLERSVSPGGDVAAVARLRRELGRLRPTLVHAHSSKAGAVARIARLAQPATPLAYTPHGYAFAGHFEHEGERRAYRAIERALAPLASRVVCVCEAEARIARSLGPARRVRVVHNGVAPVGDGPPDPRLADLRRRGPLIGALTLLRPGKGIETLIDALALIRAGRPDAQLAVCGEGPDLDVLRARAARAGVGDAVHFLGAAEYPLRAMRAFDVLAHPSWAESFPYVVLEAMSLGLPIVASDVGGIGEALLDGESGLLVPARDAATLSAALDGLLEDPARASRLGRAAAARAAARFTTEAMIRRLSGVYDELVPSAPRMDRRPFRRVGPAASEPPTR